MQIFHRSINAISRGSLVGGFVLLNFAGFLIYELEQSPFVTQQGIAQAQPVPFSHQHHVAGLGIDCRYCHTSVDRSNFAGIPPVSTCMNCHTYIWTNAQLLEPIRLAYQSGVAVQWERVHRLPDFVQFNHSIHIAKGIGCVSCHGRIDKMPLTFQAMPMTMSWCLSCHRHPEDFVRPKSKVFDMEWAPQSDGTTQAVLGPQLVREYRILSKTNCSVCHY